MIRFGVGVIVGAFTTATIAMLILLVDREADYAWGVRR